MRTVTLSISGWWICALAALVLVSCQGQIGDDKGLYEPGPGSATGSGPVVGGGDPGAIVVTDPNGVSVKGFAVPLLQPQLLPFSVRFARVAAIVGLPQTDPVFDLLKQNRTQLGDHDYANGIKADNTWTALRMSVWVKSIQPICASPAMTKRFPALPESLGALVEAAYGRAVVAEDAADVQSAMQGLTLTATQRYNTICLAVLSSMELLTQ
jgi:hypothetical protein